MSNTTEHNAREYDAHAKGWHEAMATNPGHIYVEKPAMEHELPPDLMGKSVLCIGVGSGEELSLLVKRNPLSIHAIDISERLLDIAKQHYPDVTYRCMDMMALDFPDETFDLVYSSLAFHYANDWDVLLEGVHRVLKPGGTLLFSTHHPEYWSKHPTGNSYTNVRGVKLTEHTGTLPGGVAVVYYNHPNTDSIDDALQHAGFTIVGAYAPEVVHRAIIPPGERKRYDNMVQTNTETPLFYVVRAVR